MFEVKTRARRILDLEPFFYPKVLNPIQEIDLSPPSEAQKILRMQISDGVNNSIPSELDWLHSFISIATEHQNNVIRIRHPFRHITVRHGFVDSTTDDEWHVDGFSTKFNHLPEQNYVWCSDYGTELHLKEIEFPLDFNPLEHNLNDYFEDKKIDVTHTLKPRHMYCMDPYIPHRRPKVSTGKWRTFVRLTFSPLEVADTQNTPNPDKKLHHPESRIRDGVSYRNSLKRYK